MTRQRRGAAPPRPARARPGRPPASRPSARRTSVWRRPVLLVAAAVASATVVIAVWAVVVAARPSWSAPSIAADRVVATVHGEPVTWSHVAERLRAATVMGRPAPAGLDAWRAEVRAVLESVVGDVLARHYVEGGGIVVTEAMVDAEIRRLELRHGGQSGLEAAMAEMQVAMAELRETQRRGLYLQALTDAIVTVTDADVEAYLARDGASGMSREEATERVRAERAPQVVPAFLAELRRDPGVWIIPVEDLP